MKKLNTKNNTQLPSEKTNSEEIKKEPEFDEDKQFSKRWYVILLKYLIAGAVGGGIVCMCLATRNFWSTPEMPKDLVYRYLADAFTIPGAILILLAIFMWLVGAGAITGLTYGLKHFIKHLIPGNLKKDETYAEYLERRSKSKHNYFFLLIVGACYLIVGIVFVVLFYQVYPN